MAPRKEPSRPAGTAEREHSSQPGSSDNDWSEKMDDITIVESELRPRSFGAQSLDPVDDLKARLSYWDPNLPTDKEESLYLERVASRHPAVPQVEKEDDSPYAEVRAAVHNYDVEAPCNTIRAWTIGIMLIFLGATMNTLFSLRQPSIGLGALVAQIVAWPIGHGWAKIMPKRQFNTFGLKWSLNPGPFNIKEHSIIVVMASVSFGAAYATDIILAQIAFYKQNFGIGFQLLLVISTQSIGYGLAGMLRKYLVYPAAMIWPGNLVSVTLMNAMYEDNDAKDPNVFGGTIHRYKWFAYVSLGAFVYYFIPGFLMQFLSTFAFVTWIAPQNPVVNQLFGQTTGLSLIPLTFDWTQISGFVGSPLVPPFFAIGNTILGVVIFMIIGACGVHYSGTWYSQYLPMSDSGIYDNTGSPYNISRIINPDFTLNVAQYQTYSPLFLSTTFALSYGLSFAAIASLIVFTYLEYGSLIYKQFKNVKTEEPDIHMKLMAKYKEVPTSWYAGLFVGMVVLSLFTILSFPTNLQFWAFALAILIAAGFSLPIGIIQAITNTQIGLNVLTEFVFGYLQPGKPLALMLFKTYGYITMAQALSFVGDLKFGHYSKAAAMSHQDEAAKLSKVKIPPRTMFSAQVVATTLSCFIQVGVLNFALTNIKDVCTPHQAQHFTCPAGRVFFSASVIWGLIGPARIFSPGQIYSGLFVFFGMGAMLPIGLYFASRRFPRLRLHNLNAPLIFGGSAAIPPATPLNYLSWGIVGYLFQYRIRRKYFAWWARLNYLTSAALDLGLALCTLLIFFSFTLNDISAPNWWGNQVVADTMDAQGTAVQRMLEPGQTFGPKNW